MLVLLLRSLVVASLSFAALGCAGADEPTATADGPELFLDGLRSRAEGDMQLVGEVTVAAGILDGEGLVVLSLFESGALLERVLVGRDLDDDTSVEVVLPPDPACADCDRIIDWRLDHYGGEGPVRIGWAAEVAAGVVAFSPGAIMTTRAGQPNGYEEIVNEAGVPLEETLVLRYLPEHVGNVLNIVAGPLGGGSWTWTVTDPLTGQDTTDGVIDIELTDSPCDRGVCEQPILIEAEPQRRQTTLVVRAEVRESASLESPLVRQRLIFGTAS